MKKIPVILLTGFLGAGKTTVLNEMLCFLAPFRQNTALLINDFGTVNIDAELVNEKYSSTIFKVNQGSIFCICTRDQFFKALDEIISSKPAFGLIIIEATGIASPADLNEYLKEENYDSSLEIIHNLCIIDAANFHKVFSTLPAVKDQVQEASVCIINKTDLAKDNSINLDELESKIKEINPEVKIVRSLYGKADFADILNLAKQGKWKGLSDIKKRPPAAIYTITLESDGYIEISDIKELVETIQKPLLRAKGFIHSQDKAYFVEFISGSLTFVPWNKKTDRKNKIVLIGFKMDEKILRHRFNEITRI